MSATGNSIFLLEVIVRRVTLTDPDEATSTCPLCVCFSFPGLVDLDICEGHVCDDLNGGSHRPVGAEVRMTRGMSCLFVVNAADLCRTARDFGANVVVYRRAAGAPEGTRLVAQTRMRFARSFTEIILDPDQAERTRELKRSLALYENGRAKPVGVLDAIVRLTSRGDLLVTVFDRNTDSHKYHYKGLDEYVPTNAYAPEDCLDESRRHCAKKCRKNRTKCCGRKSRAKESAETQADGGVECDKQLKRVKCVLTVMEMMKDLFVKSTLASAEQPLGGSEQAADGREARPCVFDHNCPVADCPFRTDEPLSAFVDRLTSGSVNRPATAPTTGAASAPDPGEIVDDADLFTVKVGRVDPCRTNAPVHRNKNTQYLLTDVPADYLPAPEPVAVKPKRDGKKKKSKKKGKKTGVKK